MSNHRIQSRIGLLLASAFLFAASLPAASITYEVTSSFPSGILSTAVSEPDSPFQLFFTIDLPVAAGPGSLPGGFTATPSSAWLVFGGNTIQLVANVVEFFSADQGGGLFLDATAGVDSIAFSFIAAQLFSGDPSTPQLLSGAFPVDTQDQFTFIQLGGALGTIYAPLGDTVIYADVPEPGGMILLGGGLLALILLRPRSTRS